MNRRTSLAVMAGLGGSLALMSRQAKAATNTITSDITGLTGGGQSFLGTFTVTQFAAQNSQLVAVGTLTGTLVNAVGNVIGAVTQAVTLPVTTINGTCQILHLELGPLDLNLLGLQVHLNRIVLDITAQAGGGLLGDLLCSIANLLNGGLRNILNQLVAFLNRLLGML
jgi:hypothetical protein